MIREWAKILVVYVLAISCTGCEKETKEDLIAPVQEELIEDKAPDPEVGSFKKPEDEWVIYTIPKGEHHNDLKSFESFQGDSLAFKFVFDSTAIYHTSEPQNQADWNKLMGFSDCGNFHHTNSIRLVWRYTENDRVEIGEYRYQSGERSFSTIGNVAIGDTSFASIIAGQGFYTMTLNDLQLEIPRNCDKRSGSYWLFPYFGGDETAPHDVRIHVQHLLP